MKLYSITYDLKQPGRKYNELYDAIKNMAGTGNWQHPMESLWVVAVSSYSRTTGVVIYDSIRPYIDENDSLFVTLIDHVDRQGWMPKSFWKWLKEKKDQI